VGGGFEQLQSHPRNIRRPQTFWFVMKFDQHQTLHFGERKLIPRSHLSAVDGSYNTNQPKQYFGI
jgi:hypothetical protein